MKPIEIIKLMCKLSKRKIKFSVKLIGGFLYIAHKYPHPGRISVDWSFCIPVYRCNRGTDRTYFTADEMLAKVHII